MTPTILSFGSVNIDVTATSRTLPRPGETIHAERYATGLGGKGGNQSAAASRLAPGHVALISRIGQDAFGLQARTELQNFGVDLQALHTDPANPTGIALIGIDANGENCITVVGGANMAIDTSDITRNAPLFDGAKILLMQMEIPIPAILAAARRARHNGTTVILDPAPVPETGLPDALWQTVDLVTPNETETHRLTGILPETPQDAARAAAIIQSRGTGIAIIKMGAKGVYWNDGMQDGFLPPYTVTPIDTVAAGDSFNAGLAVALSENKPLPDAVRFAAACGALATTKHGAASAAPTRIEVETLMQTTP